MRLFSSALVGQLLDAGRRDVSHCDIRDEHTSEVAVKIKGTERCLEQSEARAFCSQGILFQMCSSLFETLATFNPNTRQCNIIYMTENKDKHNRFLKLSLIL